MSEENWSTTSTTPQGGSQPPMFTAAVPPSQTEASSQHSSSSVRVRTAMLTVALGPGVTDQQEGQGGAQDGEYDGERGKAGDVHSPPPSGLGSTLREPGCSSEAALSARLAVGHRT